VAAVVAVMAEVEESKADNPSLPLPRTQVVLFVWLNARITTTIPTVATTTLPMLMPAVLMHPRVAQTPNNSSNNKIVRNSPSPGDHLEEDPRKRHITRRRPRSDKTHLAWITCKP
jgi:hypothetical protein